jgi:hypothetical protein
VGPAGAAVFLPDRRQVRRTEQWRVGCGTEWRVGCGAEGE